MSWFPDDAPVFRGQRNADDMGLPSPITAASPHTAPDDEVAAVIRDLLVIEQALAVDRNRHALPLNRAIERLIRIKEADVGLLRMWRDLVIEGGVPRYTVLPGAALNTLVTWTDAALRNSPSARSD